MKRVILICTLLLGVAIGTQAREFETSEIMELVEKPKNKKVAKYHKKYKRAFNCSLCEKKGIKKLFTRKRKNGKS